MKTLFARNSPVKVRWRFDPAMWRWFWQFARRCNQRDMIRAGHAIQSLLNSSRSLYDELLKETLTDVEWEPSGLLFVLKSQRGMDHYAETDRLLRSEFNLGATRYDGLDLLELEPALLPGNAGAWRYDVDGRLRSDKLMLAWRRALERQGVEIREQCELREFVADGRLVRRLITGDGEQLVRIPRAERGTVPFCSEDSTKGDSPRRYSDRLELEADQIVVATGAWTPKLRRLLGCSVPIQPGKGYSITMPRPTVCPRFPMIFEEHRVAITPLTSTYRIGSTMEFAGYDGSLNPARLRLLRDGAALYLREPLAEPVLESWTGWRPMTPDSLPLVGRAPALENVFVAAGHGMLGVSMSPATGRLIAEIVSGETPHIDPQPYAVARKP
jgi:D-amino-acid dehydrogenase